MTDSHGSLNPAWWVVRSVVDITVGGELTECEDRFVLIRADSEAEARTKGEREAMRYGSTYANDRGETVTWTLRGISDVREIIDVRVADGTEMYSCFVDPDLAVTLMTPRKSPLRAWEDTHPDRHANEATVGEILESWEQQDRRGPAS